LTLSRIEKSMLDIASNIMQKNIKILICVEVRILSKKVIYVRISHFSEVITTSMQIGNDSFVFKYPVTCKQKF